VSRISGLRSSVAGVADEVAFAFERRCERVEHRVEGPPELRDFVVGLLGNLEPDAGDAGDARDDLRGLAAVVLDRPQGRPGEQVADDSGGDDCAEASDAELDEQLEQCFVAVVAGSGTDLARLPARRCARGVDRPRHCRSGALADPARPAPLLDVTDDPQAV
jgi:hypothetical protein